LVIRSRAIRFFSRSLPLVACSLGLAAPALCADTVGGAWWEQVALDGDLRLRYESIRKDPGEDIERERYRARFGFSADLNDTLELGVRFATGEGDPASTNLNFGESISFDEILIDRAYIGWSASDRLQLTVGKMKNPFFRAGDTALLWDSDVNPEGVVAKFGADLFFGSIGGFQLGDRDDGVESWLYAVQAGAGFDISDSSTLTAGIGWLDYTDIAGEAPLYGRSARGNSLDAGGNYLNDYDILELFAEYEIKIGSWPVVAFVEWTRNTRAATDDTAYSVGLNVGKADEPGAAEWSWEWRDTEADALVGVLTDSDLADGRTDSRGHVLKGSYRLTDHMSIGATLIYSEYGGFNASPTDFDRVMLDVEFDY
jgi:hypothetical protein